MKRTILFAAALAVIALGAWAQQPPEQAAPPAPTPPQGADQSAEVRYTNESVARVSFVSGKAFVQRASDLGFEEAGLNMPVSEGDRIGTSDGRAEVHFGRANYLRLDNDTKVDVLNLPKKDDDIARIRVWSGDIFLVVGTLKNEKSIEVHTADASFYVLERGVYRIGVRENRDTVIEVHKGLIEAAGETGSTLLKGSQRLVVSEGRPASKPSSFIAVANDAFDKFNEARGAVTGRESAESHLPEELGDYEGDLEEYGEWTYVAPYGNVWVPNAVDDGWRPYYDGRWVWLPLTGWTWWPYEPWGWATFHYGYWHWAFDLGWYWIPYSIWGPAWVSWWWDSYYFAWSPLSYWGYPGILLGGVYYTDYYGPYYPIDSQSLTVVRRDSLAGPSVSASALTRDQVGSLDKLSLTGRRPDVVPEGSKVSVRPLDGDRVMLQKDERGSGLAKDGSGARSINRPGESGQAGAAGRTAESPRAVRRPDDPGKSSRGTERPAEPRSQGDRTSDKARTPDKGQSAPPVKKGGPGGNEALEMSVYRSDPSISGATAAAAASQARGLSAPRVYPSSPSVTRPPSYGGSGRVRSRSYASPYSRPSSGGSSSPSVSRPSSSSSRSGSSSRSSGGSRIGSSSRSSSSGSRGSVGGASRSPSSGSRGSSGGSSSRGSSSGSSSRGSSSSSGSRGSSSGGTHKK